ncbi:MAG: hypothetical protein WCA10_03325 [Terracidiphilus sp.]
MRVVAFLAVGFDSWRLTLVRAWDDPHIENLRLQVELDGYKKRYNSPRADRLQ